MPNWKKAVAVICTFAFTILPVTTRADSLHQQLHQYQQQYGQLNSQISQHKQQIATTTSQLLGLKQSVSALNDSIARYKQEIQDQQDSLLQLAARQQQMEAQRQQRASELQDFVRANYEQGASTYLSVLLNATSWSDFLDRVYETNLIIHKYGQLLQDLKSLNQELTGQQALIKQKNADLQAALQEKEQTQQSLQTATDTQQSLLSQLNSQQKATVAAALDAQSHISTIQQLIQEQEIIAAAAAKAGGEQPTRSGSGVRAPVTVSAGVSSILNYARTFLGTPYVWGGTRPVPGFDCSGYVQYVFAHFGVRLDRVSQDQFTDGIPVSKDNLQPGDLVFFTTYARGATHVGIYVGNNIMINSNAYGVAYDNLTVSYWSSRYLGARRVVH